MTRPEPSNQRHSIDSVAQLLARRRRESFNDGEPRHARSSQAYASLESDDSSLYPEALQRSVLRWRPPAAASLLLLVVALFFTAFVSYRWAGATKLEQTEISIATAQAGSVPTVSSSGDVAFTAETPSDRVIVHVTGAVQSPGVYELPSSSRIIDAVDLAGGVSEPADTEQVNLAAQVQDGMQINIPEQGEVVAALGASPPTGTLPGQGGSNTPLVNINTATSEELQTLPKIGPATAHKIIQWRETNGGFKDVSELDQVSGIGPATLEDLLPLVTVS